MIKCGSVYRFVHMPDKMAIPLESKEIFCLGNKEMVQIFMWLFF